MLPDSNPEKKTSSANIPETWKQFDSFKFDRSIQKRNGNRNLKDTKKFEDRSVFEDESKLIRSETDLFWYLFNNIERFN